MKLMSICKDRNEAAHALAHRLSDVLARAITQKGRASLVVSGGSSPLKVFELLRSAPLDWGRVQIVSSDERLVPPESGERNERMIRDSLLTGPAGEAQLISLVSDPDNADECERFANQNLKKMDLPFDAVVLGMGEDGHTASLFPDSADIQKALDSKKFCVIQRVPSQQRVRISLTPRALLNAHEINLLAFGDTKYEVLERATEPGPISELPVRVALLQTQVPVTTYWAP